MRSQIVITSSIRWEMKMIPRPRAFSSLMMSKSAETSVSVSAEVGSSMITMRAL